MRNWCFFLLTGFILFGALYAQEEEKPAPPEPSSLSLAWWDYFDVPPDQMNARIQDFTSELEQIPSQLSPQAQETASPLVKKIETDLNSLKELLSQPKLSEPDPPELADRYTINELITLNQNLRSSRIHLESQRDDLEKLKEQLKGYEEELDRLRQVYNGIEGKKNEKILTGLRLIDANISMKLTNEKIDRANELIENSKITISQLEKEIDAAIGRLEMDPRDLYDISQQVQASRSSFIAAQDKTKEKLAEQVPSLPSDVEEMTFARRSLYDQQLLQLHAQQAEARLLYIRNQIKYYLANLLNNPEQIDNKEILNSISQWKKEFTDLQRQIKHWKTDTQNLSLRLSELLSIEDPAVPNTVQYRSILEDAREITQKNLLLLQKLENEMEDSSFLLRVLSMESGHIFGNGKYFLEQITWLFYGVGDAVWTAVGRTLFYVGNRPITGLGILRFFLVILIAYWLSRYVLGWLTNIIRKRRGIRKSLMYRINRLIQYLILFVGLLAAFISLGFDVSNLIILASALGIGLGFGLQSIFNNFISGLIILFGSQLKVGDYIELETGLRGEIREINVRSTVVRTNDGDDVIIPNSEMISKRLVNWTLYEPYRRIHVSFSVAYGSDKELVSKLVVEAAKKVPITLTKIGIPEPRVYLSKFGDNALEFELVVWVDEKATRRTTYTQSQYLWEIETVFQQHGIQIPFPQRDLHIKDAFGKEEFKDFRKKDSSEGE